MRWDCALRNPRIRNEVLEGVGFTDLHIADALCGFPSTGFKELPAGRGEVAVTIRRHEIGIHPRFRMVDSCAREFALSPRIITPRMKVAQVKMELT